jgi:hypothetical protein
MPINNYPVCTTQLKSVEGAFDEEKIEENPNIDESLSITIFPNPNQGQFQIAVNSDKIADITVFNSLGQQLKNVSGLYQIDIDLGNQPKGMYFVTVKVGDKTYNDKFLVK